MAKLLEKQNLKNEKDMLSWQGTPRNTLKTKKLRRYSSENEKETREVQYEESGESGDFDMQPDDRIPRKDDFVLVKFNSDVFYVGHLLSDMDSQNDFQISCLRKCNKQQECFRYPNVPYLACVSKKGCGLHSSTIIAATLQKIASDN
ncbi:hypothetical protein JTB14_021854 [Gonioctena quinquepunctata]|nr:hypothetical protein JTB14_021854 [Gonioctena quinquepunctata]